MLKQLTDKYYALRLPIEIDNYGKIDNTGVFFENGYLDEPTIIPIPFNFDIITLSSQATEEQAKMIVKKNQYGHNGWKTYTEKSGLMYWENTALESLQTLLTSKECYKVNPYSKPSLSDFMYLNKPQNDKQELFIDANIQWQQAQKHVGEYLIIKKLN